MKIKNNKTRKNYRQGAESCCGDPDEYVNKLFGSFYNISFNFTI
jgi:hypothetical protein